MMKILAPILIAMMMNDSPEVTAVVEGIAKSHRDLLQLPGGISMKYELKVEQHPKQPAIIWMNGLKGTLAVKWPLLKSRNEGEMASHQTLGPSMSRMVLEPTFREANYNFEKQVSAAREGNTLGQIANFRHAFSATTLYPLRLQYYEEADQYYVPGKENKLNRLLPGSLRDAGYRTGAKEVLGGIECEIIQRANDRLWIAPGHSFVVCKRESANEAGTLVERVVNENLQEVSEGVWIPFRQTQEIFEPSMPDGRLFKITVETTGVEVGKTEKADLEVTLDKDVRYIEDHINKTTSLREGNDKDPFDLSVEHVTKGGGNLSRWRRLGQPDIPTIIWLNLIAALSAVLFVVSRRVYQLIRPNPQFGESRREF